jgi:hypothetical protein
MLDSVGGKCRRENSEFRRQNLRAPNAELRMAGSDLRADRQHWSPWTYDLIAKPVASEMRPSADSGNQRCPSENATLSAPGSDWSK